MRRPAGRERNLTNSGQRPRRRRRHRGKARQCQVEREQRHRERGERDIAGADLAAHQPAAQGRADADADRKGGKEQDHDTAAGAEGRFREGRQLRHQHAADEPEPRRPEDRQPDLAALPGLAQDGDRRRCRVPAQPQPGRGGRGGRDAEAGAQAERGAAQKQHAGSGRPPPHGNREPAGDCAEQDRQKGTGLHHRIAVDQLAGRQMLRQQSVFDRARERRLRAQHEEASERRH